MIELEHFAREGRLRELLDQPWLQAFNGVEGISLSYDERLVAECDRLVYGILRQGWRGTLEYSRYVAELLAAVAYRAEGRVDPKRAIPFPGRFADQAWRWWQATTERSEEAYRSPIVVEIAVRKNFGREARPERRVREYPYSFRIRRSRGGRLHGAAAGGTIVARLTDGNSRGTLGGFLVDSFNGDLFGVTAAHVSRQKRVRAGPTPLPRAPAPLRNGARLLLNRIGLGRYERETCPWHWESPADRVAATACSLETTPQTSGLDVALHRVESQARLQAIGLAGVQDISPLLDLSFTGATSGYQRARATNYSIWHSYEIDGEDVCIHGCVQIKLAGRQYVRTDLSRRGDSGAWLLARGTHGLYWTGVLTGGDGDLAGIVPARRIVERIRTDLGLTVEPLI